jgi:hypothetical protein
MKILFFVLWAMSSLAPGRDHAPLATAIAARVLAEPPLFRDDESKLRTAAYLVAIAFRESSLTVDIVGDHGRSFCAFQIHASSGGTAALQTDPDACVATAFAMLRTSMRVCPSAPLAWYAEGGANACSSVRAQRISRDRMAIAARLFKGSAAAWVPFVAVDAAVAVQP